RENPSESVIQFVGLCRICFVSLSFSTRKRGTNLVANIGGSSFGSLLSGTCAVHAKNCSLASTCAENCCTSALLRASFSEVFASNASLDCHSILCACRGLISPHGQKIKRVSKSFRCLMP